MKLDLNATFIDDSVKVWAFHPGKGKRYFRNFAESEKIFLDLPGVGLSNQLVDNEPLLCKSILMSNALDSFYRKGKGQGIEPSRDPNDYVMDKKNTLSHVVTSTRRFVKEIKKGDIILVAPRRQYESILYGIVTDDFDPQKKALVNPYLKDRVNIRSVDWVDSYSSKRQLPDELAMKLENRHTIIELDGQYRSDALAAAFDNYVTPTTSKLDVHCMGYRGKNPLETVDIQELIGFFSAIYFMNQEGLLSEAEGKSFRDIAHNYYDESLISSIETEFHSPGYYRITALTAGLSLFLGACITLAVLGRFDDKSVSKLEVINSKSAQSDAQNKEMKSLIQSTVKSIAPGAKDTVNKKGVRAHGELRVQTNLRYATK